MDNPHTPSMNNRTLGLGLALVAVAALYRVLSAAWLPSLPNFSPVMAIAFCGGLMLPGVFAFAVPFVALLASDLMLNAYLGQPLFSAGMAGIYACYLLAVLVGCALRGRNLFAIFGAVVGNAVLFYLVTNTLAWWGNVHYAQTFAGLVQSLTTGVPGFPPTWTFFRNSLAGDLLFTGVFLGAFYWARKRSAPPSLARQESAS